MKGTDERVERRRSGVQLVLLAASAFISPSIAAEVSAIVTVSSEYIYRGQAISDHNPALSAGIDYEHESGWFAGAWASTIDLDSPFGHRDLEVDYYGGYHYRNDGRLELAASVIRYTYPGQTGSHDYDHNEYLVAVTLDERHTLEFGYTADVYGLERSARHWELRSEWPTASAWIVGGGVGLNDLRNVGSTRYLHWDLGASTRFAWLTVDLRYYDNEMPGGGFGRWSAGSRVVLSLSRAF